MRQCGGWCLHPTNGQSPKSRQLTIPCFTVIIVILFVTTLPSFGTHKHTHSTLSCVLDIVLLPLVEFTERYPIDRPENRRCRHQLDLDAL
jgi:hypothetical protein